MRRSSGRPFKIDLTRYGVESNPGPTDPVTLIQTRKENEETEKQICTLLNQPSEIMQIPGVPDYAMAYSKLQSEVTMAPPEIMPNLLSFIEKMAD